MVTSWPVTGRRASSSRSNSPCYSRARVTRVASGDGVEQALEFRLGRGGDTVEAGLFIFEGVGAVDEEHVQGVCSGR